MKKLFAAHKILSLIVVAAIILSGVPLTAAAENSPPPDSEITALSNGDGSELEIGEGETEAVTGDGEVATSGNTNPRPDNIPLGYSVVAFAALADDVANQTVTPDTAPSDLTLPKSLDATVSDGEIETETTIDGVTWRSEPEYAAVTIGALEIVPVGTYVFTPELPQDYTIADGVVLPAITVAVEPMGVKAAADGPAIDSNRIFANGTPVTIKMDGGTTKIYSNTNLDNALFSGTDVSGCYIYGGWKDGDHTGGTSITVDGGVMDQLSIICGGSYQGKLTGDTHITIKNNATVSNIYGGGGELGLTPSDVDGNTFIEITDSAVIDWQAVVGGGRCGTVSGDTSVIITDIKSQETYVYGGGWYGSDSEVGGNTQVAISGGTYTLVAGGGAQGAPTCGKTFVEISDNATVEVVYGGGLSTGATVGGGTSVVIDGSTVGWVYGGGQSEGIIGGTTVTVQGNSHIIGDGNGNGSVYGGGRGDEYGGTTYVADVTGDTSVEIKNSEVTGWVYGGGGYGSVTGDTSVTLTNATVGKSVFGGGGWSAGHDITGNTSVEINGGTYSWIYGGGEAGSVTGKAVVTINGGTVTNNVYGGCYGNYDWNSSSWGALSVTGSTDITVKDGTISGKIYGGGYYDTITGTAIVNIYPDATISGSITHKNEYGTVGSGSKVNYWYKVVYDKNGGSGTAPTESGTNNGYVAAGASAFTAAPASGMTPPSGKQFKEWNTQANGQGIGYAPSAAVVIGNPASHQYGDFTLYAIWETSTLTNLNTPTGLTLSNAGGASWNAVTNATGYRVQLYKDGTAQDAAVSASNTNYDFLSTIRAAGIGTYSFTVVAAANPLTHLDSAESSQAGSFVLKKIASIITPAAITKPVGTSEGSAGLPSTVSATLNSGTATIPVTWSGYDASAAGTFTLTGTLGTLPNDVINPDSVACPGLSLTFTATAPTDYTIAVSANPAAGGTVSGGGTFADGTSCTVTATANGTYQFANWTEGSTVVSTDANYTFTLNSDRTLVANFVNSGKVDVIPDNKGDAPATTMPDPDAVLGAVLEPQDVTDINNGSTITVTLEVVDTTPPQPDQQAVEGELGNKLVGMYLDISMFKQKDSDPKQPITQLNSPIQIEFDVPANLKAPSGKTRTFSIIRVHGGAADILPNLSGNSNKIRFETDRFSTYAIVYQDAATPPPPNPPINPPSSSSDSGSSSGGGGTASNIVTTYWIEKAEAKAMAKTAKEKELDYVRSRRATITGIRKNALLALTGLRYQHDTVEGNAVQVRVYVDDPAKAKKDILVSGYVKGDTVDKVKAKFEKWFQNKVAVVSFDQQGDFGMTVQIAAKVDLNGMDTNNLYFYGYDRKTNKYSRINTEYRIDTNDYLHFATELAGDIIVSNGPLAKKTEAQIAADGDKYYYLSATPTLESLNIDGGNSMFSVAEPPQDAPQNPCVGGDSLSYMNAADTPLKLEKVDTQSADGVLVIDLDAPVTQDALGDSLERDKVSVYVVLGITSVLLLAAMMLWAAIPRKDDPLVSVEDYRKKH